MTPWFWFWIGISFAAGLNAGVILMAVLAMARDLPTPAGDELAPEVPLFVPSESKG